MTNKTEHSENEIFKKDAQSEWMELFSTATWAIVVALIIRTFLFEPFNIPSGSMKPNLLVGDYLFVSKYSYGYSRYSLPFGLPLFKDRILSAEPKRGDIAVFKLPSDTRIDYIKRVVGLPGDVIKMQNGRLYINGEQVRRELLDVTVEMDSAGRERRTNIYREYLPDTAPHIIYEESDRGPLDNTAEYHVPEGHFFMMGDNRDNSQDSRVTNLVGPVPLDHFVGRAERLFFSTNGNAKLWEFWRWPQTVRYSRLLKSVE